ncbi:hypothetical protein LEP1GSC061_1411 [Leptospira wolffii serovar Khorat str. Khorat-H2]|nr:hypothetical protein LEP1GSC061_1411 [Leptospira wolffii serovar Khorat str. Khorat-H2]
MNTKFKREAITLENPTEKKLRMNPEALRRRNVSDTNLDAFDRWVILYCR